MWAKCTSRPPASPRTSRQRTIIRRLALAVGTYAGALAAIAWFTVAPKPMRMAETPKRRGMDYRDARVTSTDGVSLAAWVVPAKGKPRALVVLCHGIDGNRGQVFDKLAFLHEMGCSVLLFDFRARGESSGPRCTIGNREQDDLRAVLAFARSADDLRGLPVVVIGESMGGAVAILVAGRADSGVAGVISESSFASLDHAISSHFASAFGFMGPLFSVPTNLLSASLLGASSCDIAPVRAVGKLDPRPVLLIHDSDDTIAPRSEADLLFAAATGAKELWVVPGAPHVCAYIVDRPGYEARVTAFINRVVARASRP